MTDKAPVTVEQGDVDAANAWYADHIGEGVAPGSLCVAFASARLQSIAALEEEIKRLKTRLEVVDGWSEDADGIACRNDTIALQDERIKRQAEEIKRLREAITRALACTPSIRSTPSQFHGHGDIRTIVYDCGDPWEILRTALEGRGS